MSESGAESILNHQGHAQGQDLRVYQGLDREAHLDQNRGLKVGLDLVVGRDHSPEVCRDQEAAPEIVPGRNLDLGVDPDLELARALDLNRVQEEVLDLLQDPDEAHDLLRDPEEIRDLPRDPDEVHDRPSNRGKVPDLLQVHRKLPGPDLVAAADLRAVDLTSNLRAVDLRVISFPLQYRIYNLIDVIVYCSKK